MQSVGAAGLQSANILDAKFGMLRQRGQLRTEGGSFIRHQMMNARSVNQHSSRRKTFMSKESKPGSVDSTGVPQEVSIEQY